MTYQREPGNPSIGVNDGDSTVYIIRVSDTHIALAQSLTDANNDDRIDLDDDGDDRDRHALVRRTIGLTSGVTYYVVNHGDFGANTFQLENSGGQHRVADRLRGHRYAHARRRGHRARSRRPGRTPCTSTSRRTGGDNQRLWAPAACRCGRSHRRPATASRRPSGSGGGGGFVGSGDPDGTTFIITPSTRTSPRRSSRPATTSSISSVSHARGSAYGTSALGWLRPGRQRRREARLHELQPRVHRRRRRRRRRCDRRLRPRRPPRLDPRDVVAERRRSSRRPTAAASCRTPTPRASCSSTAPRRPSSASPPTSTRTR